MQWKLYRIMKNRKSPNIFFLGVDSKKKLKILTVMVVWQTYLRLGYNVRYQYFKLVGFIIQAIFVKKFCNRVLLGIMVEL